MTGCGIEFLRKKRAYSLAQLVATIPSALQTNMAIFIIRGFKAAL
jgi:hypothetical protein